MSEPMKFSVRVQAPARRVLHALTDAAEMRVWLAEHAEVDLPHTYAFWGRYTPEGDAPHQRPLHVDDSTVRFGWLIDGEDTTVELRLAEHEDGTIIELSQSHYPGWKVAVQEVSIRGALHTYWALSMANLIDHVEGRPLMPKVDFTSTDLTAEVLIGASRQDVYDALMDPDKFSRWFGAKVGIEPWVGGRWAMGGFENEPQPAKIIDLEEGRKVAIQFADGEVSAWELEESNGKTRLTFVHSGFDEGKPSWGAWMGWLSGIAELRRFLEMDDWRSVWVSEDIPELPKDMLATESS
ncbi:SRPBCC domain-containing protein [Lentzea tibetensis]|uniref:SRPBCC domain-containing protein n=1 Tax=Lentzea tibetensis TaxID=2591470 RepID=A0A563ERA0_9PSEU|nr:SRPBCC domain-containing protein [Lentzea tibetensis]TWP50190.1 SRPBCC domain-containing protein [Lentzea tibetensis]